MRAKTRTPPEVNPDTARKDRLICYLFVGSALAYQLERSSSAHPFPWAVGPMVSVLVSCASAERSRRPRCSVMHVTRRVRRFATLVVLSLAAAPLGAEAQQFVCWPIARGDSASALALRFMGDAATAYSDRFQIWDPARRAFLPKSRYGRLSTEWQACVARELPQRAAVARLPEGLPQRPSHYDTMRALQIGLAVSLMLFAGSVVMRYVPPRPMPPDLRRAGEEFVAAFARPLIDPSTDTPPIRARLRFVRRMEQLDICIAPNTGRCYPNLLDHKRNVEYNVDRVMQLLGTRVVVSDRLRSEGRWVVVTIGLANLKQAGAK